MAIVMAAASGLKAVTAAAIRGAQRGVEGGYNELKDMARKSGDAAQGIIQSPVAGIISRLAKAGVTSSTNLSVNATAGTTTMVATNTTDVADQILGIDKSQNLSIKNVVQQVSGKPLPGMFQGLAQFRNSAPNGTQQLQAAASLPSPPPNVSHSNRS